METALELLLSGCKLGVSFLKDIKSKIYSEANNI